MIIFVKMFCVNFKHLPNNIIRYFFLVLFLGYLGSITFFTHTHQIENGVIIVHSHPFKSGTDKSPVNHQHTTQGFVLIHFLSTFLTSALLCVLAIKCFKQVSFKIKLLKSDYNFSESASSYWYGLRAPPLKYCI